MNQSLPRFIVALFVLLFATACSLPRGAAIQNEILSKPEIENAEFAIYPVTRALIPEMAKWPKQTSHHSSGWIAHKKPQTSRVIKPGDRLNLLVWDSGENSLLTSSDQKSIKMNEVLVAPDGTIFVPYLERILVKGQSPQQAREMIQKRLEGIVSSAQVQLSRLPGRQNSVDLVGGVGRAGNYPLPSRDFTILNLISLGGGVVTGLRNPQIRLVRDGRLYLNSVSRLFQHPRLDTALRGGDKVIITKDERYFLSLGAAGSEDLVYFVKDNISALDAMSMIGGISDTRADPKGILVLREYRDQTTGNDGSGPRNNRVVFTLDLTSADGLFSAGNFAIQPKDVVLVTESSVTSLRTVFGLIGKFFGIANAI